MSDTLVAERTVPRPRPVRVIDVAAQLVRMRPPEAQDAVELSKQFDQYAASVGADLSKLPTEVLTAMRAAWVARTEYDRIHGNLAARLTADRLRHTA